jgi:hypothetical protein
MSIQVFPKANQTAKAHLSEQQKFFGTNAIVVQPPQPNNAGWNGKGIRPPQNVKGAK